MIDWIKVLHTHKIGHFQDTLPVCSLGTQEHQDILVSMLEKATEQIIIMSVLLDGSISNDFDWLLILVLSHALFTLN